MTFKGDYTIIFSKRFEKENTVKVTLKSFRFPHFPNPNFKPTFSLGLLHVMSRCSVVSNACCQSINEHVRFSRQKIHLVKFNIRYLVNVT